MFDVSLGIPHDSLLCLGWRLRIDVTPHNPARPSACPTVRPACPIRSFCPRCVASRSLLFSDQVNSGIALVTLSLLENDGVFRTS